MANDYGRRVAVLLLLLSPLAESSDFVPGTDPVADLATVPVTARDLKTLQYMENAHGQLEEWTSRLFARLKNGVGPRAPDPMLDGRADLQVQKISVTYAGYTHNEALARVLRELAEVEQRRVDAVREMIREGPDESAWAAADAPVQQIVQFIRDWSERS